jgi:hypothetical protein
MNRDEEYSQLTDARKGVRPRTGKLEDEGTCRNQGCQEHVITSSCTFTAVVQGGYRKLRNHAVGVSGRQARAACPSPNDRLMTA